MRAIGSLRARADSEKLKDELEMSRLLYEKQRNEKDLRIKELGIELEELSLKRSIEDKALVLETRAKMIRNALREEGKIEAILSGDGRSKSLGVIYEEICGLGSTSLADNYSTEGNVCVLCVTGNCGGENCTHI